MKITNKHINMTNLSFSKNMSGYFDKTGKQEIDDANMKKAVDDIKEGRGIIITNVQPDKQKEIAELNDITLENIIIGINNLIDLVNELYQLKPTKYLGDALIDLKSAQKSLNKLK